MQASAMIADSQSVKSAEGGENEDLMGQAEAFIYVAMIRLGLRRLARP